MSISSLSKLQQVVLGYIVLVRPILEHSREIAFFRQWPGRLKKWYLMPPCLTLSIIKQGSRVKWSNPGKEVAPSLTHWCSSHRKGSLKVTLDYGRQFYL